MSWRDAWSPAALRPALHVALAADGLRYLALAAATRRVVEHGHVACAATGQPWQAPLDALAQLLARRQQRNEQLHVVLSNGFVHYQLLTWRPGIAGGEEWQAYAGLRFRDVFGEAATDWQIRVDPVPPGATALACAMPRPLLEGLRRLGQGGVRLASVQPYFAAAFNRRGRRLRGEHVWFGVVEPGRICLALLHQGRWQALRNESSGEPWLQALGGMLRRLQLPLGARMSQGELSLCGVLPDGVLGGTPGAGIPEYLNGIALRCLPPAGRWTSDQQACAAALGH